MGGFDQNSVTDRAGIWRAIRAALVYVEHGLDEVLFESISSRCRLGPRDHGPQG